MVILQKKSNKIQNFETRQKLCFNEDGALLITIIITIVVVSILGAAIVSMNSSSMLSMVSESLGTKVEYLNESGVNYVRAEYKNQSGLGNKFNILESMHNQDVSLGTSAGKFKPEMHSFWFVPKNSYSKGTAVIATKVLGAFPSNYDTTKIAGNIKLRVGVLGNYYSIASCIPNETNSEIEFTLTSPGLDEDITTDTSLYLAFTLPTQAEVIEGGKLIVSNSEYADTFLNLFPKRYGYFEISGGLYIYMQRKEGSVILEDIRGVDNATFPLNLNKPLVLKKQVLVEVTGEAGNVSNTTRFYLPIGDENVTPAETVEASEITMDSDASKNFADTPGIATDDTCNTWKEGEVEFNKVIKTDYGDINFAVVFKDIKQESADELVNEGLTDYSKDFKAYLWEVMKWPEGVTKRNINAIWGKDEDNVYAVGDNGIVLYYNGNPEMQWINIPSPTSRKLNGIWGDGNDFIIAVGDNRTIIYTDGGALKNKPPYEGKDLNGVWGYSKKDASGNTIENDIWIACDEATILNWKWPGTWVRNHSDDYNVFTPNGLWSYQKDARYRTPGQPEKPGYPYGDYPCCGFTSVSCPASERAAYCNGWTPPRKLSTGFITGLGYDNIKVENCSGTVVKYNKGPFDSVRYFGKYCNPTNPIDVSFTQYYWGTDIGGEVQLYPYNPADNPLPDYKAIYGFQAPGIKGHSGLGDYYSLYIVGENGQGVVRKTQNINLWRHYYNYAGYNQFSTNLPTRNYPWDDPQIINNGWKPYDLRDVGMKTGESLNGVWTLDVDPREDYVNLIAIGVGGNKSDNGIIWYYPQTNEETCLLCDITPCSPEPNYCKNLLQPVNEYGDKRSFNSIVGGDMFTIYAVGDKGGIIHYDGSFGNVETMTVPKSVKDINLNSIWMPLGDADSESVFVGGDSGTILHLMKKPDKYAMVAYNKYPELNTRWTKTNKFLSYTVQTKMKWGDDLRYAASGINFRWHKSENQSPVTTKEEGYGVSINMADKQLIVLWKKYVIANKGYVRWLACKDISDDAKIRGTEILDAGGNSTGKYRPFADLLSLFVRVHEKKIDDTKFNDVNIYYGDASNGTPDDKYNNIDRELYKPAVKGGTILWPLWDLNNWTKCNTAPDCPANWTGATKCPCSEVDFLTVVDNVSVAVDPVPPTDSQGYWFINPEAEELGEIERLADGHTLRLPNFVTPDTGSNIFSITRPEIGLHVFGDVGAGETFIAFVDDNIILGAESAGGKPSSIQEGMQD